MAKLILSKKRKKLNLCLPFLYHSRKCWVNFARFVVVEVRHNYYSFAYELHQTTLVMASTQVTQLLAVQFTSLSD